TGILTTTAWPGGINSAGRARPCRISSARKPGGQKGNPERRMLSLNRTPPAGGMITTISRSDMRTLLYSIALCLFAVSAQAAPKYHAIAMYGTPKYAAGFQHFDYVNADAPRGGTLRRHVIGTFDSLNPFIPRGTPAGGIAYLYDTLTTASQDEPFTQYGLLAEFIEMPEDRSWVIYHLRKEARFADGEPVTAGDVVFSFNTL